LQERYGDNPATIQNSIRICGWRLDYLINPIEIRFTVFLTLQLRICKWAVVYRSLVPCNRVRANNLLLSRWLYDNKFKLRRPDLVLRWPNLDLRWPAWWIKWIFSSSCWQPLLVQVVNFIALVVSMKIYLLPLL